MKRQSQGHDVAARPDSPIRFLQWKHYLVFAWLATCSGILLGIIAYQFEDEIRQSPAIAFGIIALAIPFGATLLSLWLNMTQGFRRWLLLILPALIFFPIATRILLLILPTVYLVYLTMAYSRIRKTQ